MALQVIPSLQLILLQLIIWLLAVAVAVAVQVALVAQAAVAAVWYVLVRPFLHQEGWATPLPLEVEERAA